MTSIQTILLTIRSQLGPVKQDTRLEDDLGMDSLDTVEFLMKLEDEFRIDFGEYSGKRLDTVNDVIEGVLQLKEAR